jgi:hypothetical protein
MPIIFNLSDDNFPIFYERSVKIYLEGVVARCFLNDLLKVTLLLKPTS